MESRTSLSSLGKPERIFSLLKGVPDSDRGYFRFFILPVAFIELLLQWGLSFIDIKHWKFLQVFVNVKYSHLLPFSIHALLGKGK